MQRQRKRLRVFQVFHQCYSKNFLEYDFDLLGLYNFYYVIMQFCFDIEYNIKLNSLSAFERFFLLQHKLGPHYFYTQELIIGKLVYLFLKKSYMIK